MSNARRGASTLTVTGVSVASALVPLNSTMIAVALPRIAEAFDIRTGQAAVLVTVYLAAMLLVQPVAGVLCDAVGARRLSVIALVGFGVFSAAAMLAGTFPALVLLRGGQAVFAAALAPSVQSMLRTMTEPSERGRAFGTLGSVIGIGAGLGPVLGGVLVGLFGWQAIFAVNLPVIAIVLVVLIRARAVHGAAAARPRGDDSTAGRERILNRTYVLALATQSLSVLTQYALLLITPIILHARHWGSGSIGLALSLLTLGLIVMGPLGGRLGDRRGRRVPVVIGIALAAAPVVVSSLFGDEISTLWLLFTLAVFGVGTGLASPSIAAVALEAAPEGRIGVAAGLLSTSRYVGSIVASVALAVLVDDDAGGVGIVMVIAAASIGAAVLTAVQLPRMHSGSSVLVPGRAPRRQRAGC
ncbi:MAG: major facilitator transporter [Acidimicrobiaceae bacterium]|nr:MAG: major facilitator transporter [Acidimicrobiaceae bacterium]